MQRIVRPAGAAIRSGRVLRLAGLVATVLVGLWLHQRYDLRALLSLEHLRTVVGDRLGLGMLVVAGACALGVLLHLPGWLMIGTGGVLLGAVPGFVAGWLGGFVGAVIAFQIARQTAQGTVQDALLVRFPRLRAFDERLARHGFRTVLAMRLLLMLSAPLNWALGLSRLPFRDYLGATAIGITPGIAAVSYAAGAIAETGSLAVLLQPRILVPLGAMMTAVIVGSIWGRKLLGRPSQASGQASGQAPG